ncbi:unnamed protein product [Sphenostylis stenocarpa]|uniref:Uncharacterized protein n=1 Tax=Sphenostylis stenocarpa TaxID=92480 RepID=A0AA86RXX4_9FABA|nr:unnamed protein product [Sphenostylis stenocarpa]
MACTHEKNEVLEDGKRYKQLNDPYEIIARVIYVLTSTELVTVHFGSVTELNLTSRDSILRTSNYSLKAPHKHLHARDGMVPYSHGIANQPAHTLSRDFSMPRSLSLYNQPCSSTLITMQWKSESD